MSAELEQLVAKLVEEVRTLREQVETPLPAMLSLPRAALQLSVSVKTLHRMISLGTIATLRYEEGGHRFVPATEIRRLQTLAKPDTPVIRRSGGRPKATRHDPRSELETLREKLKKG